VASTPILSGPRDRSAWHPAGGRPVPTEGRSVTSRQNCIANFPVEEKLYIGAGGIRSQRQIRAIDRIETFSDVRDFIEVASGGRLS
jgi:hypothetical protein